MHLVKTLFVTASVSHATLDYNGKEALDLTYYNLFITRWKKINKKQNNETFFQVALQRLFINFYRIMRVALTLPTVKYK